MKTRTFFPVFRIAAAVAFLATLTLWGIGGFHSGWTQTSLTETHIDEITEIAYPIRREAFVPGVDVLAAGSLLSIGLAGISFIGRNRNR